MNTELLAACAALLLVGCAGVKDVRLPDGSVGHAITCGTASKCMNEAASICAGPYEIINQQGGSTSGSSGWTDTQQVYNSSTRTYDTVAVQRGAYSGSSFVQLVFACRPPAPAVKSDAELQAEVYEEVRRFSQDPRHPYYERLKLQMAEYLENNQADSLEAAYAKACAIDAQCSAQSGAKQ